ncbi:MAG: serine/threonine-protein kinase, partial [Kofleriaceae bacterium]
MDDDTVSATATTIDSQLRAIAAIPERGLPAGTRVGRYEIVRPLGAGGMGVVYEARDQELARLVALKIVRPHGVVLAEAERRLRREAQTMAKLPTTSCVVVHEVGSYDGRLFIAMELMPGGTLRDWMGRPRRWQDVVARFLAVGRGLVAAHTAGIVHRDFKPENVLVGAHDEVRIADFGLARPIELGPVAPDAVLDTSGVAGTPAYMPPEQLRGELADERGDQFSFAVAFYEALEGDRPYRPTAAPGSTLRAFARSTPPWLRAILTRALAREPAERWPTLVAMLDAIERRVRRRRRSFIAVTTAVILATAVATTAFVVHRARPAAPPRSPIAWEPDLLASVASADALPVAVAWNGSLVYTSDREWWVQPRGSTDGVHHELPAVVPTGEWAASPDARTLYVAGQTAAGFQIWELATDGSGYRRVALAPVQQLVHAAPDGRSLLIAEPEDPAQLVDARVIDVATLGSRELLHQVHLVTAAWAPDGHRVAFVVRGAADEILIVDVATGARTSSGTSAGPIGGLAWIESRGLVVAVGMDRRSRLETWLLDEAGHRTAIAELYELPPLFTIRWLQATREGMYFVTDGLDMHLFQLDLDPPAPPRRLDTRAAQDLAAVGWTAQHELVFGSMGERMRTLALPPQGPPRVVADERAVAVTEDAIWLRRQDDATGRVWLARAGHSETPTLDLAAPRVSVSCAADQRAPCIVMFAGDANNKAVVSLALHRWMPGTPTLGPTLATVSASEDSLFSLSPDGGTVAVGREGAIELLDLAHGGSTRVAQDPAATYLASAWALDGTLYATLALTDGSECRV